MRLALSKQYTRQTCARSVSTIGHLQHGWQSDRPECASRRNIATPRWYADDIDVALLVDQKQFDQLIEQSFAKEVAKVRAEVSIHCG